MIFYFLLFHIASLFNPKARKIVRGQRDTWRRLSAEKPAGKYVWFHAASVGEFEQARPIIERLRREHSEKKILLTFFSSSGYEMRKDYPHVDLVLYLPFATRRNARRFLSMIDVEMAIFVKYEYWPAYLKALRKRAIPTYIIAAIFRPKQAFFRWYGAPYRRLLKLFSILFVQDEASRELLERYHITNAIVAGDTRFDRVSEICSTERDIPVVDRFIHPAVSPLSVLQPPIEKILVAGSTWPADEALLQRYVAEHPDVRLILVPHELTPRHLHSIFNLFDGRFVRYTEANQRNISAARTLVVDTMGLLSSLYRFGTVAYIGGGFGEGIHNTIEAAVYGMPVVFGPRYDKFREAHDLIRLGAGISVSDYPTLAAALDRAFADRAAMGTAARDYVRSQLGSTHAIYSALF